MRRIGAGLLMMALAGVTTGAPRADPDGDPANTPFVSERLTDRLAVMHASGGNVAILWGGEGILLVDSDYAGAHAAAVAAIDALSDGAGRPRWVIDTHYHLDHADGSRRFAGEGASVVAQRNVPPRLRRGATVQVGPYQQVIPPTPEAELPQLTFDRHMSLSFDGETIDVAHYPAAHTDGDSVVFFRKAGVVHMGDIFVRYGFPFIDVPAGGRIDGMIAACRAVLAATGAGTRFIPGHGATASRADLTAYVAMLTDAREAVAQAKRRGLTLDRITRDHVLRRWEASYANPFVSAGFFIGEIYRSLSDAPPAEVDVRAGG